MSLLLVNAFPNAAHRESVYVTNGNVNEILHLEQFAEEQVSIEKGIDVVTSFSSTHNISDEDILDYSYRPSNTNAFVFDIYNPTINHEEAHNKFMSVVKQLGSRLIVMDLNGDPESEVVSNLMDECDVILYIFRPIIQEVEEAKRYYDSLDDDEKLRVKFVCNMWDVLGVKKKSVQDIIKIRTNNILWFPYHTNIQRTMFEGRLCVLNRLMIEGRDGCVSLRQPIKDILSFVCDTPSMKIIKEVNKWEL